MTKIFVCYSRDDAIHCKQISNLLRKSFDVWFDEAISGGEDWWNEILAQISQCDYFIYLLSREALESEWCSKEFEEAKRLSKHVIPVQVRRSVNLPEVIERIQVIPWYQDELNALNEIYVAILQGLPKKAQAGEINEEVKKANLRILNKLWPLISSEVVHALNFHIGATHKMPKELVNKKVYKYIELRDFQPECHFSIKSLEVAFGEFDEILVKLVNDYLTTDFFDESEEYYIHDYRLSKREGGLDKETYNYLLKRIRELNNLLIVFLEAHNKLVQSIQQILPEFTFGES